MNLLIFWKEVNSRLKPVHGCLCSLEILLRSERFIAESILLLERRLPLLAGALAERPDVPAYIVNDEVMNQIAAPKAGIVRAILVEIAGRVEKKTGLPITVVHRDVARTDMMKPVGRTTAGT